MNVTKIAGKFVSVVAKARDADDRTLMLLRKALIGIIETIGPKQFVTIAANLIKNEFQIKGCNDARIPLKKIFTTSLAELDKILSDKNAKLPPGHPINTLINDHRINVNKLKVVNFTLSRIKNGTPYKEAVNRLKDYYAELDTHIRKEEEVLFPMLEKNGMEEHPENLRQEHKRFKETLQDTIETLEKTNPKTLDTAVQKAADFNKDFIPDISNHIFRETFVFYPAALEFVNNTAQWHEIKKAFELVR